MSAAPPQPEYGNRDIIVIGGSAGGVEAASEIIRGLPADLPAAVFLVIHRAPEGPHLLPEILDAVGSLPVVTATEGERFVRGRIYVPPLDRHVLIEGNHLHVRRGPLENRTRPAIDPLFRSAAASCSTRVIGVVLSGMLDDGAAGLLAIKCCGGLAVVQDPQDAFCPSMPNSALAHVAVDHVLPAADIASLLTELAVTPAPSAVKVPEEIRLEARIAGEELFIMPDHTRLGSPSPLTCPECDGSMQEIRENGIVRYRCHTGHGFTLETLGQAVSEAWERTLYGGMRAQQQHAMVVRRLAEENRRQGNETAAAAYERRARDYEEGAMIIRQILARLGNNSRAEDQPGGDPPAPAKAG